MLKTMKGSQDGVTVEAFEDGRIYTITDYLAGVFIDNNWAENIRSEDSDMLETPENQKDKKPVKGKK